MTTWVSTQSEEGEQVVRQGAQGRKEDALGSLSSDVSRLLQILFLEPELLQAVRRSVVLRQVEQALGGRLTLGEVEGLRDARDGVRREGGVVGDGMREDDGVGLGVGHAEGAAEGVALTRRRRVSERTGRSNRRERKEEDVQACGEDSYQRHRGKFRTPTHRTTHHSCRPCRSGPS
jgi:hypothetical protein